MSPASATVRTASARGEEARAFDGAHGPGDEGGVSARPRGHDGAVDAGGDGGGQSEGKAWPVPQAKALQRVTRQRRTRRRMGAPRLVNAARMVARFTMGCQVAEDLEVARGTARGGARCGAGRGVTYGVNGVVKVKIGRGVPWRRLEGGEAVVEALAERRIDERGWIEARPRECVRGGGRVVIDRRGEGDGDWKVIIGGGEGRSIVMNGMCLSWHVLLRRTLSMLDCRYGRRGWCASAGSVLASSNTRVGRRGR